MSRIAVVGAGYVGLVTGAGLSHLGHSVILLETDRARLARLLAGESLIHEPGLGELIADERASDRLGFTDDYAATIPSADFAFIAVNTPMGHDGHADMGQLMGAVEMLLAYARPGLTIVTKSTVPPGTGDAIDDLVVASGHHGIDVVSNPEFLREGSAVHDFLHPDRIVVGAERPEAADGVARLYEGLEAPVLFTSRRSAELAKYAANALLATRISFMNEIASISASIGADVDEVARVIGADSRIGPKFLQAGLGWGGSCFPKDLRALAATASRSGQRASIIEAVMEVNSTQRRRAIDILVTATAGRQDATIGVFGLSFKPDTDDLRGSPALEIIDGLIERGIRVRAHDPQAMPAALRSRPDIRLADDPYGVTEAADAVLLATEWPEYLQLDWTRIRGQMRGRMVLDGRNALHGGLLAALGFDYRSFGRPDIGLSSNGTNGHHELVAIDGSPLRPAPVSAASAGASSDQVA